MSAARGLQAIKKLYTTFLEVFWVVVTSWILSMCENFNLYKHNLSEIQVAYGRITNHQSKQITHLLTEIPIQFGGGQQMGQRVQAMEQHGGELDHDDGAEEQEEHETDRFQR